MQDEISDFTLRQRRSNEESGDSGQNFEVNCDAIGGLWLPCFAGAQPPTPLRNDIFTVRLREQFFP